MEEMGQIERQRDKPPETTNHTKDSDYSWCVSVCGFLKLIIKGKVEDRKFLGRMRKWDQNLYVLFEDHSRVQWLRMVKSPPDGRSTVMDVWSDALHMLHD